MWIFLHLLSLARSSEMISSIFFLFKKITSRKFTFFVNKSVQFFGVILNLRKENMVNYFYIYLIPQQWSLKQKIVVFSFMPVPELFRLKSTSFFLKKSYTFGAHCMYNPNFLGSWCNKSEWWS